VLPFATEWFDLSPKTRDFALLAALASTTAMGLLIHASGSLQRVVDSLAGPPDRPARALVLVAAFASAGLLAMVALTAALGATL
jgi:hypothetical protein